MASPETDYESWVSYSRTSDEVIAAMRRQVAGLKSLPLISLALVVSDADEVWIKSSVDSVLRQVYPRLELCVCDNGSARRHVPEVLADYAAADGRVKVRRLAEKKSWSEAYNAAISMTAGEFVAVLEAGDEVAREALFRAVELLQSVRADVIYTDEDHIDIGGRRSSPVFKPYWSPDLLLSTAYIGRLCLVRRSVLGAPHVFREGFEGAEEQDLMLRLSERTDGVRHLPEVLYHRRKLPGSGARGQTTPQAIGDALARRGVDAALGPGLVQGSFRVVRRVPEHCKVSVIVSAPEGMLDTSVVDRLEQQTSYPIHRLIVASIGREGRPGLANVNHSFPARALNLAAGEAEGEYLAFIDARVRPETPGWLQELLREAQSREAGAVGCKLLDPSGGVQHGGSLAEMSRLTGSADEPVFEGGHYLPLVDYTFNFGAASAECMVVRRASFERVGGFDDTNLPTAFYDLDLSFRLRELGLKNVYTPYARATCRGGRTLPGQGEVRYMWGRWWSELVRSLYYRHSPLNPAYHELDTQVLAVASS